MYEFSFLGHKFSSYWTMLIIAAFLTLLLSFLRAKRYKFSKAKAVFIGLLVIVFGCTGAKLLFMLEHPGGSFSLRGGMSLFGSVFLIPVAFGLILYGLKIRYFQCMDFVAIYGPLIFAFMRIGCYLNGCCGGNEISLFGNVFVPPVQLIECAFDVAIFFLLLFKERYKNIPGSGKQYPTFMICYAVARFFIEFMRATEKNIFYLSEGQWLSILSFLIGVGVLCFINKNKKCKREV